MKDKLQLIFGLLVWATPIITYCTAFWLAIKLFVLPLVAIYGFWSWLGMLLGLVAMSLASCWFFFWLITTTKRPQATYKRPTC